MPIKKIEYKSTRQAKQWMNTISLLIQTEDLCMWTCFWTDRSQGLPRVGGVGEKVKRRQVIGKSQLVRRNLRKSILSERFFSCFVLLALWYSFSVFFLLALLFPYYIALDMSVLNCNIKTKIYGPVVRKVAF